MSSFLRHFHHLCKARTPRFAHCPVATSSHPCTIQHPVCVYPPMKALSRPSLSFHDVSRFRMCLLVQTKSEGVGERAASALRVLLTLFLSSHFPFLNRGRQRPWPPPRRSVGEHHLCRADRTPDTRPWDGARSESTLFRKEGRRCCLLCIWKGSLYFKYPIRTTTLLSLTNN